MMASQCGRANTLSIGTRWIWVRKETLLVCWYDACNWSLYFLNLSREKYSFSGELASAIRARNITFGLYHTLMEWYHPLYLDDSSRNFTTQQFTDSVVLPSMKDLVSTLLPN